MAQEAVSVISPQFCSHPQPMELTIARKFLTTNGSRHEVTDVNGNVVFTIPLHRFTSPDTREIIDSSGTVIVTLCRKRYSRHNRRWQVFGGKSTEQSDLIFRTSAKLSSIMYPRNELHVFSANHTSQDQMCDYIVKAKGAMTSCEVYAGSDQSSTAIIAQMYRKFAFFGRDKYMTTVYPNVDYAFVVSLIVILDEIMSSD